MDADNTKEQVVGVIDDAIAPVAEETRDDQQCALLLAQLDAIKQRVLDNRIDRD